MIIRYFYCECFTYKETFFSFNRQQYAKWIHVRSVYFYVGFDVDILFLEVKLEPPLWEAISQKAVSKVEGCFYAAKGDCYFSNRRENGSVFTGEVVKLYISLNYFYGNINSREKLIKKRRVQLKRARKRSEKLCHIKLFNFWIWNII